MKIVVFTYRYPIKNITNDYIFVKQLIDAFAMLGHECYIVSPFNVLHYRKIVSSTSTYKIGDTLVHVLRPWFLSFSRFGFLNRLSRKFVIKKVLKKIKIRPDVVYGHFWNSAYEGYHYASSYDIPLFVASGESQILFRRTKRTAAFCDYVKGVICVSSKNKEESVKLKLAEEFDCCVLPNAVNTAIFKQLDKKECRRILGLEEGIFIVVFVGWFNVRKGVQRVANALNLIEGKPVYSIFIGKGKDKPTCKNILFEGCVAHEHIPIYLNAADCFVLPTLHEGCCNAVIEAMACGLPIISSDLAFNRDVLNEENSLLIDPLSIEEIKNSIIEMRDNEILRQRLSIGALRTVNKLSIEQRAKNIIDFMYTKI